MFLSGKSMEENGESIFTPFRKAQIDCNSYKLRVGSDAYVSPEKPRSKKAPISQLYNSEALTIPPGQFAFLITQEHIQIPYDLMAFINIRNGLKVQGLINVSGFHVDPGYKGKLIFSVFNSGPKSIIIREGDECFLIWLARLENASVEYSRDKIGFNSISSELISNIPQEGISLSSLSKKVDTLNQEFRAVKWIAGTATTLAIALLVLLVKAK